MNNQHMFKIGYTEGYEQGRMEAIDELVDKCKFIYCNGHDVERQIKKIAEQLKEKTNEDVRNNRDNRMW